MTTLMQYDSDLRKRQAELVNGTLYQQPYEEMLSDYDAWRVSPAYCPFPVPRADQPILEQTALLTLINALAIAEMGLTMLEP